MAERVTGMTQWAAGRAASRRSAFSLLPQWPHWPSCGYPGGLPASGKFGYLHVDPFLQRVFQVLLADGLRQGSESRLELDDGRWQVFEPAAQLHLLQNAGALS